MRDLKKTKLFLFLGWKSSLGIVVFAVGVVVELRIGLDGVQKNWSEMSLGKGIERFLGRIEFLVWRMVVLELRQWVERGFEMSQSFGEPNEDCQWRKIVAGVDQMALVMKMSLLGEGEVRWKGIQSFEDLEVAHGAAVALLPSAHFVHVLVLREEVHALEITNRVLLEVDFLFRSL